MIGWVAFSVGAVVVLVVAVIALRRLSRWNEPSLDSQEKQAEAFMWSQRTGSGGWGS